VSVGIAKVTGVDSPWTVVRATSGESLLGGRLLWAFESTELETDSERCQAWLGRFAPAGGHLAYVLMI
jgi:hypothetical protein